MWGTPAQLSKGQQLKYLASVWLAIFFALSGCSFNVNDVQFIVIETYPETEKNVKLAEDLMYYDSRYIAYKVPSLNESTAKGIKLGYFVRSEDGKPGYKITYSMKVPAVASNIDSLKSDFKTFIPKLAKFHASKDELFRNLSPKGQDWARSLFSRSTENILSSSSSLLRDSMTEEQLTAAIKNLLSEYDVPISTDFIRAQYYEEFEGIPEFLSIHYLQTYKNDKKALIRVNFHQENGSWAVMGFGVGPHA